MTPCYESNPATIHSHRRNFFRRGQRARRAFAGAIFRGRRGDATAGHRGAACRRRPESGLPGLRIERRGTSGNLAEPVHGRSAQPAGDFVRASAVLSVRQRVVDCGLAAGISDRSDGFEPGDRRNAAGSLLAGLDGGRIVGVEARAGGAPRETARVQRVLRAFRMHGAARPGAGSA